MSARETVLAVQMIIGIIVDHTSHLLKEYYGSYSFGKNVMFEDVHEQEHEQGRYTQNGQVLEPTDQQDHECTENEALKLT